MVYKMLRPEERILINAAHSNKKHVVVCLGASIVRGQVSYNFVNILESRLARDGFQFINEGVAGDQAYNTLMRLFSVIRLQPDFVIILVGTNDVTAELNPGLARISRFTRRFPQPPSAQFYRDNMKKMVKELKEKTSAKIALVALPVLGEDLESVSNRRIREYNGLLEHIAGEEQIDFLPVYERQRDFLLNVNGGKGRSYENGGNLPLKALLRRYILRQSFDVISRKNRFVLLTDGIHMNSIGATLIADEVEKFLRSRAENE